MKIRIVEETYDYDSDCSRVWPISDVLEVSEGEYELLKQFYKVQLLQEKEWFVEQANKEVKHREAQRKAWEEADAKRKAKAAETAEKRKLKQLEKLRKELGLEDSIK